MRRPNLATLEDAPRKVKVSAFWILDFRFWIWEGAAEALRVLFVLLIPKFFSRREQNAHHRAHRDHREEYFCLRGQGLRFLSLLTHSFYLRLFSVTSVASVVKSFLGCGRHLRCVKSFEAG
jgi:hypothetical protein